MEQENKVIRKEHGQYICPHNEACRCDRMNCENCGWNPKVAKQRADAFMNQMRRAYCG